MAEWLRRGLQILVWGFDSLRGLHQNCFLYAPLAHANATKLRVDTMIAETQRQMMVDGQIRTNEVSNPALLDALYAVPRESFVPLSARSVAYVDREIEVGTGRFLLSPMVAAKLIQALDLREGDKVLDIAGGSGYSRAIMERMGAHVTMLENVTPESSIDASSIDAVTGPLNEGVASRAPFSAILINGSIDYVSPSLLAQLGKGGRLVAIVGQGRSGKACIFERNGDTFSTRSLFDASAPFLREFERVVDFAF